MDLNKYEVLAPIGNYEEIDLVLNEKPDAVYIGLKGKTSRPSVSDFSMEQLKKAIIKCHEKNIKIYVAINSNISQDAMDELLKNIYELDRDGVDAFILADFGLIKTVSHKLKNAKIHASTLLGVYNINTVRLLKELGVTRIIFYANLYIDEIAKIINAEPDLEYELVAEGGTCFNDIRQCRLPHITDDNKHILYCRNGCMLCDENNIKKGKMIAEHPVRVAEVVGIYMGLGIKSFKIEGRTVPAKERIPMIRDLKKYIQKFESGQPLKSYLHYVNRIRREIL